MFLSPRCPLKLLGHLDLGPDDASGEWTPTRCVVPFSHDTVGMPLPNQLWSVEPPNVRPWVLLGD